MLRVSAIQMQMCEDIEQNIQKAKEFGHSEANELKLLYIHALLHLLGYDHEIDSGEHRKEEERLINKFNLPSSLIVRNS